MRLFIIEADSQADKLKAGMADFIIYNEVHTHKPYIKLMRTPEILGVPSFGQMLGVNSPLSKPFNNVWFSEYSSPPSALIIIHFKDEFKEDSRRTEDEFPEEIDTRPKYWFPKNWVYSYGGLLVSDPSNEQFFHHNVVYRMREKRI